MDENLIASTQAPTPTIPIPSQYAGAYRYIMSRLPDKPLTIDCLGDQVLHRFRPYGIGAVITVDAHFPIAVVFWEIPPFHDPFYLICPIGALYLLRKGAHCVK